MGYLIILVIVIAVFLFYRFSDRIEKYWPWFWKNIGQPLFNYFFVISVRKLTMAYFATVAGINVTFPVVKIIFDNEQNLEAAVSFNGNGIDWAAVIITVFLTIAYIVFIIHENKQLRSVSLDTVEDVVDAVQKQVGRGSLEIVKDSLPEIRNCISTLHVNTAYGLLGTMRAEVDKARMPDWSLLARIDYLMGACKRFIDKDQCKMHFKRAYDEMDKSGTFDKEIVAGRICEACKENDSLLATALSKELREHDNQNIWGWIPFVLESRDLKADIDRLPNEIKDKNKLLAEVLSLGRQDVLEAQNALTLVIPEMEVMTIDNFVLWPYWLSVALTQFVATWKLGADGGCLETDASKKMLELTDQYFDLLHHTQLPNLMPDIDFIHVFVAYNHDHCPQRIEEMAKLKPSDSNKEIYYLAYASMLQSANMYPEAFSLLAKYDGEPSISIMNDWLQLAVRIDNISEIESVFKQMTEKQIVIPDTMVSSFSASLHICSDKVSPFVSQLKFGNEVTRRLFLELYNFKAGNDVDIEYVKAHAEEIPHDMIAYMATLFQKYGMTDTAIEKLESVLSDSYFDYRNYVYVELLQSDKKYNSKLYGYLKELREKGLASDDLKQKEMMMAERMMDFKRVVIISTELIKKHPENGILMEHHLMALYRNDQTDEIERLFPDLKNLQFPETSVQNIFNIYLITGRYEKALAFLYDEIQKNNSQILRDFFFQVHLHKGIADLIMKQYDVVALDSYVLINVDGKEEYTTIRPGSYLEDLIGKKVGEEISFNSVNKEIKVVVMAVFNRYFKLMKEIMDEIAKHQSKHIRSFTIDDLQGGEGILANLAKIAGPTEDYSAEEEKMKSLYSVGRTTMYYFINQHQLFPELYKLIFGDFRIRMIPVQAVKHQVQMVELNVSQLKPVLDLSSLLLLHELQLKYNLALPFKCIIPHSMQVAIHDVAVKERNAIPSFLSESVASQLTIKVEDEREHPLLSKLNMLEKWISEYCELEDDEELLNVDLEKMPSELSALYMQCVRLANKPDRILITEDWTATHIDLRAYPAMNVVNWLSIIGIGDEKELHLYLSRINYLGCNLCAYYIFEQYNSKKANQANNFGTCLENIEFNPYIASEVFRAGNLMLSSIVVPSDRLVVSSMFASVFKNLEYQQAASILNMAMRMYRNNEYQQCLMQGFRMAHPIIV